MGMRGMRWDAWGCGWMHGDAVGCGGMRGMRWNAWKCSKTRWDVVGCVGCNGMQMDAVGYGGPSHLLIRWVWCCFVSLNLQGFLRN